MNLEQKIKEIENHLSRLEVDTDVNPYSGLTVREGQLSEDTYGLDKSKDRVNLFDDHADSDFYLDELLEALKDIKMATLDDSKNNIWQLIYDLQIS